MIKLVGMVCILFSSTTIGYIYSIELKKRVEQLRQMQCAMKIMENEMVYSHSILSDIFYTISDKCTGALSDIFLQIGELLSGNKVENVCEAFTLIIAKEGRSLHLKKEDLEILLDLGKNIGISDIDGHRNIFMLSQERLGINIENAESNMKKNTKIYRYLGFAVGAVTMILLV